MIRISIVTITYNAARTLQRTLDSVLSQTYPHIEHLIIDGASKDDTLRIAQQYQTTSRHEVIIQSEPDNGLYDAMNKGLQKATGHYIVFLNAGDSLYAPDTIQTVVNAITPHSSDIILQTSSLPAVVYGQTDVVDEEGNYLHPRHLTAPARLTWRSFQRGMLVCHQAFYARTDLAQQCPYDRRYRFSADFDWCVRIMRKAARKKLPLVYTGTTVADFMDGGMTTKNHSLSLRERFRIMTRHYGWLPTVAWHGWFLMRRLLKRN